MYEIITVINQKGGVGKTTTAAAITAGLTKKGYKTLCIDLDSQSNLSYNLNANKNDFNIMNVLLNDADISETIINTIHGDIIAASSALARADAIITETGKEYKLKEALEPLQSVYDYIVIDTPPALGIITINALTASNSVIIPAQADIFSLQGIGNLYQTINTVKKYCNNDLKIKGILLTRFNSRANLTKEVEHLLDEMAINLYTKVFKNKIRECIAIKEAQASRDNIFNYAARSNAATDYNNFIEEMLEE